MRGVKLYGWSRLKRIAYVVFLGTYKCVKLIFVAVLTIGIWGVHGKFAGTFNMCLSRLLAYAQPYPPPPPFYLGGGEGMATHRLRFFRKGLKETYSDKLSQLSWKIFHFALKSFFLNFCNWTELVFRLFVDTGSLDQLFRYLFPFFSLDNPLSRKEERPETKQFFGMELH